MAPVTELHVRRAGIRHRLRAAGWISVGVFSVLCGRLVQLQVLQGEQHEAIVSRNALREVRVAAPRGRVLDRTGEVLAGSRAAVDLVVWAGDVEEHAALTEALLPALSGDQRAQLAEVLEDGHAHGRVVARDLSEAAQARLAAVQHELSGVRLVTGDERTYPQGALAGHLLGYVAEVNRSDLLRLDPLRYRSGDRVGRQGLEKALEADLAGIPGRTAHPVDARGRPVSLLDGLPWQDWLLAAREDVREPARAGAQVQLTLDARIQRVAEEALGDEAGAAVMIDVHTGEVLAYASTPAPDPDAMARGLDRDAWKALQEDPYDPLLDRPSRGLYPPASTFKAVTAAAAVEAGVDPDTVVHCPGAWYLGGHRFRCWKRGGHGDVNLTQALEQSCDVWFYEIGTRLGVDRIAAAARALGLGGPTGWELGGERTGLVPSPDWMQKRYGRTWQKGDTVSVTIGQGTNLVTPLQLAVMTATVANGGDRVVPWVVEEVVAANGATVRAGGPRPKVASGLSEPALDAVRAGMDAVMNGERGTARRQAIEGLPYAGKTGTAQTVSAALRAANPVRETEDHALFVAFAPLDDPRVAVSVVVEHVGGGSTHAAPVARAMLEEWGRIEGILPPEDALTALDTEVQP